MHLDVSRIQTSPIHALVARRSLRTQVDVARELAALLPSVQDVLAGSPLALAIGFPRDGLTDYDLAFPVDHPLEREGFTHKTLPVVPMFSITHRGSLDKASEDEGTLNTTWQRFIAYIRQHKPLLGDDPQRFVYHDGLDSLGSENEHVVLEIQVPYHWPLWLGAFERGVNASLDREEAAHVLAGSQDLVGEPDGERAAAWVQAAIDKLDGAVADDATRARILNPCAHHYIVQSAELMQTLWERAGKDLHTLVDLITAESAFGSAYWIDETGPEPLLMIRRRPARMEAYEKAIDPVEKRYHACFCPLVREAIRDGKPVSRTFCHCSSGWFVQEWRIVFGEDPDVRLVETLLDGAAACVFAVKIPPGFL